MTRPSELPPFLRPLLIWIAGILIHTNFRPGIYSFAILLPTLGILAGSAVSSRFCEGDKGKVRSAGWTWSLAFGCMLLFLSITTTSIRERRMANSPTTTWSRQWAKQMQTELAEPIRSLRISDDAKAMLAAITIGSREGMSKSMKQSFSATGAAHILSVSGFHVGVLCGALTLVTSFLKGSQARRFIRFGIITAAIWTFAFITGLAPPTMRAAITLSFYLCSLMIERRSRGYNNLFAAAFLMLLCNPYDLFDVGFQLSYISVLSIIMLYPPIFGLIEVHNPILRIPWESISISIAAQVGVSFLCIYYFGQLSVIFILANLYIGLTATILIPVALLWLLLPCTTPLYNVLEGCIEFLAENMVATTASFARMPWATISLSLNQPTTLFCYAALLLSLHFYFSQKKTEGDDRYIQSEEEEPRKES